MFNSYDIEDLPEKPWKYWHESEDDKPSPTPHRGSIFARLRSAISKPLHFNHDANTVRRNINKICHAMGLQSVGIHGLRHSFVSLAYHLGVPEKIVMEIGGWHD